MLPDWRLIPPYEIQKHFRVAGGAANEEVILEVNCPTAGLHPITGEVLPARTKNGRIYIQPPIKIFSLEG